MNSNNENIEGLTTQLLSGDEETRRSAVLSLAGRPLDSTKGTLLKAMGDESWRVRKEAVDILLLAPVDEEVMEEIIGLLGSHDNAGLRNSAVETLERLGGRAVPVLCGHCEEADHDVRKFVLDILGSIGDAEAVPFLIKALDDPEPNVSAAAAENLGRIGDGRAVPFLLQALDKPDIWLRFTILEALGNIGKPVPFAAIAPLAEENFLKKAVFDCFGSIGDCEALPLLFEGIKERVRNVRDSAVLALMRLRDRLPEEEALRLVDKRLAECRGAPFVEGLLASFDTADRGLKESLIRVLGTIGDERAIGGLLHCCRDDRLRGSVLQAVGRMGERAAPVVIGLYHGVDNDMRCIIAYLCGELRFEGSAPLIVEGMRDENPLLRRVAISAAGKLGDPVLIDEISSLLSDTDQEVRAGSIEALSRLAKDNPREVERIACGLANDGDPEKRRDAAILYGSLAERERLSLLVKDEDPMVRRIAVNALSSLGNGGGTAPLVMALVDEDADVRIAAAESLGESGGEEVLLPLLLALRDDDPWVRCAVLKSLGRLRLSGAREAVLEVLDGSTDGLLTITAMETLAKICGEGSVERVKKALSNSDEEVVKSAMEILSEYGSDWIDECREMLLNHPHWDVRRYFIRLMVAAKGEKSLPHLRSAIDFEGDDLVREQILEILDRYR